MDKSEQKISKSLQKSYENVLFLVMPLAQHKSFPNLWEDKFVGRKQVFKRTLSTRSLVFPSYQGDSTIFHKGNFLKLKGVVLPHPPLS